MLERSLFQQCEAPCFGVGSRRHLVEIDPARERRGIERDSELPGVDPLVDQPGDLFSEYIEDLQVYKRPLGNRETNVGHRVERIWIVLKERKPGG